MPTCLKCRTEKPITEFVPTKSIFHPKNHSIICLTCLEKMVDPTNLETVDKMCQWLDIPFLVNEWTRIWKAAKERTLHVYVKLLSENPSYESLDWQTVNEKWLAAEACGTLENNIPVVEEGWRREMMRKWPSDMPRDDEDYMYLENFFNDLCATQNLVSATQRDDAKRLCEVGLLATKKIRAGLDAKNEMAIYHNIVKTEGFEPKNAKNIGDFDSVGELYMWLEKRGWMPKWHTEPQDSVDFTIKNIQKYLQRLVAGEGALSDQVETRRKQLEVANRLEEDYDDLSDDDNEAIEYEGENELEDELDDGALN